MSYSTDKATLLATQLERLATLNVYQLVGQRENLSFWLDEAAQALAVLDDYPARFRRLKTAQQQWVSAHRVILPVYCPLCGGACEFGPRPPDPPRKVPTEELEHARQSLRTACRRLLLRLYRNHMLDADELRASGERVDTWFEPDDLVREEPPAPEP